MGYLFFSSFGVAISAIDRGKKKIYNKIGSKNMDTKQKFYILLNVGAKMKDEGNFIELTKSKSNYYRITKVLLKKNVEIENKSLIHLGTYFLINSLHFFSAIFQKVCLNYFISKLF